MGNNGIKVYLELGEMLKYDVSEDYPVLEKNIGEDKTILVKDIYNYMINSESDEFNPKGYNSAQVKVARVIEKTYESVNHTPNIMYKTTSGNTSFMQFDRKLLSYPDAFHVENTGQEFGDLEESILKEHVYLIAVPQDVGGKK